jgi:hypothetical protein
MISISVFPAFLISRPRSTTARCSAAIAIALS